MEYKILAETLVLYACKNPKNDRFKTIFPFDDSGEVLGEHTRLFKSRKLAEEIKGDFSEIVKVKLVEIE